MVWVETRVVVLDTLNGSGAWFQKKPAVYNIRFLIKGGKGTLGKEEACYLLHISFSEFLIFF